MSYKQIIIESFSVLNIENAQLRKHIIKNYINIFVDLFKISKISYIALKGIENHIPVFSDVRDILRCTPPESERE